MRLRDLFRPFGASSQDANSDRTVLPSSSPTSTALTRRPNRLKRRPTRRATAELTHVLTSSNLSVQPAHPAFHSTPDLLARPATPYLEGPMHQLSSSWTPMPTLAMRPTSREISDHSSWKSHQGSVSRGSPTRRQHEGSQTHTQLPTPRDSLQQPPGNIEPGSPAYGLRMEGLFSHELPYDSESPLSQLAAGWTHSQSHQRQSRPLPEQPSRPTRPTAHDWAANSRRGSPVSTRSEEKRASSSSQPIVVGETRRHRSPSPTGTYYIVPGGMNVIFQDEQGNEITRVGDFDGRRRRGSATSDDHVQHPQHHEDRRKARRPRDENDTRGRHQHRGSGRSRRSYSSDSESHRQRNEATVVLIDRSGRQIPIMPYGHRRPRD
ncbi:hypothetical protein MKEN_00078500 [Mycena kentingensis (nom. inval.)]|nr:hypothetical protein MKEN_00078500 [Mycena kentingensis (nom. inval.)]